MNMKKIFEERVFKKIMTVVALALTALLVFQAGVFVGYHKAEFSYRFGEQYYKGIAGPRKGMMGFPGRDFPNSHGVAGKIVKIELPSLVVEGPDHIEKVVLLSDKTSVRQFKETVPQSTLKPDMFVVVFGEPNEKGQIEAKLLRILPEGPESISATSTSR